jgi:aspartyl-tRNA(Asn)/glutamyl-tRNA(Gln) amidotransferase subunit A
MNPLSLNKLSHALHSKTISSVELTTDYLKRIREHDALNAFISIDEENALHEAKIADQLLSQNRGTPLTGIPMAHKDIFCTKTMRTTCGSKMLANFKSPYQATLVRHLEAQAVVLLGKTNMDEFAMGSTNESSFFGAVKNPWDQTCVPGGSSGGSAAAVAASLCAFATASDTGGSVRQPAAFCGISGLKPTYGLVSRFGMIAYASSLDQAGIMASSAEDIALILQSIAAFDENDSTSVECEIPNYKKATVTPVKNVRIGLPKCFFHPDVASDIQDAVLEAVKIYENSGAEIVELDLNLHPQWIPCYYMIACAEASSNLSRYDGIRYGHRSTQADTLRELITHSREEGFGREVKRRILTGTHLLSAGYYDAYYVQAQKIRRLIRDELINALKTVDVILGPTTPTCAFKLNETTVNPAQRYLADVFTVGANLAGLPAISIPGGFSKAGLPIGIQLLGAHFDEARLLQIAHHYQLQTNWHLMKPTLNGGSV